MNNSSLIHTLYTVTFYQPLECSSSKTFLDFNLAAVFISNESEKKKGHLSYPLLNV